MWVTGLFFIECTTDRFNHLVVGRLIRFRGGDQVGVHIASGRMSKKIMFAARLERCSWLIHHKHIIVYPKNYIQKFIWPEAAVDEVIWHKFYEKSRFVFVQRSTCTSKDSTFITLHVHLKQVDGAISELLLNIVIK